MNFSITPFNRMRQALLASMFVGMSLGAQAQKFAYIDSEYVLLHMPEYAEAQMELNNLAIGWQAEIEDKLEAADRLEVAYRAERVLLTTEMRVKREEEITKKRTEAKDMQKQKFGVDGELFTKRQELIEPVQQQIFESLKDIASGSGYMVIFDKSNQSNMLYTNPKYDISDRLIKKLGYVPGETVEPKDDKDEGKGDSLMDRGRDAVNGAKDNARDRINGVTGGRGAGGPGGRGSVSRSGSKN
ncbi:MAG: OmpH family outer membrane protein [Bacteroidota bacterium]|nr:OmpH family outer membrane protein [Bacteroidota bacterium]